MQQSIVTIEKLVFGGWGLARTDAGVVLVGDVAPGKTVAIRPVGRRGGVVTARPMSVLSPSPDRRVPACPYASVCGGCDWLHLSHEAQLSNKTSIFLDCMRRIGRIAAMPAPECIAAEASGYRHRAQIKIDAGGNAGFFARTTNTVVPIASCMQLVAPLNGLLAGFSDHAIACPADTRACMVIAGDNGSVASSPVIPGVTGDSVIITAGNRTFETTGGGFFQSNRPLLEKLGRWAAPLVSGARCLDLYGGSGFFSIMLADRFEQGLLVETDESLVAAARTNFRRNGVTHVAARAARAEALVSIAASFPPDVLIVDPPRPGLAGRVREGIAALRPPAILYVSCNPPTQARDAGFLVNEAGYTVTNAALIDLYPNTHHMESLLMLSRQEGGGPAA